jgi:exopolysaccharide biosynthesis polyprenyl glycosylphosphotransferase
VVFTAVLAASALLHANYSGVFFLAGAASATLASFALAISNRRLVTPHVVIAGGRSNDIRLDGQFVAAPSLAELEAFIDRGRCNWCLVADLHYPHSETCTKLLAKASLAGIPVYHYRQIAEMQTGQVKITHLSENDLGSLVPNASYLTLKRAIDLVAALALLPACLVLFVVLGLMIKLDTPGPAFFIQERVGFRGQKFNMIKLRTMRERKPVGDGCEKRDDAMTKDGDDRITPIGRFLRKSRLDELPQIFNILRGDMSFVGPRPEAHALSCWYETELPFYSYRHIVRPGITGWAQVNQGHVTDVSDVLYKLRYDFYYVKNISLWLDVLVGLKTIRVILAGIGAR